MANERERNLTIDSHANGRKVKGNGKLYKLRGYEVCGNVDGEWLLKVQVVDNKQCSAGSQSTNVKAIEQSLQKKLPRLKYHRRMFHKRGLPHTCFFGKDWGHSGSKRLTSKQQILSHLAQLQSECSDYIDVIFSEDKEQDHAAEAKSEEAKKMKQVFKELQTWISVGQRKKHGMAVLTRCLASEVKASKSYEEEDTDDDESLVGVAEDATEPTDFGHWEAKADLALHLFVGSCVQKTLKINKSFHVKCN
jgi:hypothetical protein